MKRRLFSILLTLALCVGLMPMTAVPVHAATEVDSGTCGANVTWSLDDDGLLTISGTGEMEGGAYAGNYGSHCAEIKSAVVGSGVTNVGSSAFYRRKLIGSGNYEELIFSNLTNVQLSDTIKSIGANAFCKTTIDSITIPNSVTVLDNQAFEESGFTHLVLPDSVVSIGYRAFASAKRLEEVTLPDTLTNLSASVFAGCTALETIHFNGVIKSIDDSAFYGCTALPSLKLAVDGKNASIGNNVFDNVGSNVVTIYGIPGGTVESGASAKNYTFVTAQNTFKFDANGGAGSMDDLPVTFDSADKGNFPANNFTNGNKTFTGWNTKEDGTGLSVDDQSPIRIMGVNGNIKLYAQWIDPPSTPYEVYIGGVQVTSANADDVFGDGKVSYDRDTNTLHLSNYSYTGTGYEFTTTVGSNLRKNCAPLYVAETDTAFILDITGSNSLINNCADSSITHAAAVQVKGSGSGDFQIKGDGSLLVKSSPAANTVEYPCGLKVEGCSSTTVDGMSLNVIAENGTASNPAIYISNDYSSFTIQNGGTLIAQADKVAISENWATSTNHNMLVFGSDYTVLISENKDGSNASTLNAVGSYSISLLGAMGGGKDYKYVKIETVPYDINVSVTNIADGSILEGATVQIFEKNSPSYILEEWTSTKIAHQIKNLEPGVEYVLHETVAPDGYLLASNASFSYKNGKVTSTGTMTEDGTLLVENEMTRVSILTTDGSGAPLAGATVQILSSDGNVITEWNSTKNAYQVEKLKTNEEYTLHETAHPEEYNAVTDQTFTISEAGSVTYTGVIDSAGNLLMKHDAATPAVSDYTVNVSAGAGGTATADPASGPQGTEVTLTATPTEGYQFKEWQVVSGGVTIENDKFEIGTENVEIRAVFEVKPNKVADPVLPKTTTFTDSMTIEISCETEDAEIYYTTGGAIVLYTGPFTIAETTTVKTHATKTGFEDSEVVTATYTKTTPSGGGGGTAPAEPELAEPEPTEPDEFPFEDVPEDAYFRKPVEWAVEKGITNGVSEDKYGPEMSCTRAQVVTFLWITCGSEDAGIETGFDDVDVAAYYDKAVAWAVEKGITAGTSENEFSPDVTITRAQFVTMLWAAKGKPEAAGEMPFLDVPADAYYAKAVAWAYANDITVGKSANSFAPDDPCTRAQIMTFLYNAYAE